MTDSNLETWEKELLAMPEIKPSDSASNKSNHLSDDNPQESDQGIYAKLKSDNDGWEQEVQRHREKNNKVLLWIENLISTHPEGVDDLTYALAQPSSDPYDLRTTSSYAPLEDMDPVKPLSINGAGGAEVENEENGMTMEELGAEVSAALESWLMGGDSM